MVVMYICVAVMICPTAMPEKSAPSVNVTELNMFAAVVLHFEEGHEATRRSPNLTFPPEKADEQSVAAARLRLGMLLIVVTVVPNENALATVVATGSDIWVMVHMGSDMEFACAFW